MIIFSWNNRLYLHLHSHFEGPPHLDIHLWRNQAADLQWQKRTKNRRRRK